MSARKVLFGPIPARAFKDMRLGNWHFRVLGVVAMHDRLGKNKQGCWGANRTLARESANSELHFSDALSDLRLWEYITSESDPKDHRRKIHRVVYADADWETIQKTAPRETSTMGKNSPSETSTIGKETSTNTPRNFHSENAKSLSEQGGISPNILREPQDIRRVDLGFRRDCAEARQPRKQGLSVEEARRLLEDTESYLSEVQLQLSDPITAPAVGCEYRKLADIADSINLPDDIRSRAASLRDLARAA